MFEIFLLIILFIPLAIAAIAIWAMSVLVGRMFRLISGIFGLSAR